MTLVKKNLIFFIRLNNSLVKINKMFSSWRESFCGVTQGSVLELILFSIYSNDLCYVCNFVDDTTPFVCQKNLKNILTFQQERMLFKSFLKPV